MELNELKQKIEEIQKSSRALRTKYEQAYAEHMAKRPSGSNRTSWSSDFYEQGKKNFPDYFEAQQNIDALKNKIAKIEKKQVSQQRKNAISPLAEALEKRGDLINNAHKIQNISFKSLPVDVFNGAGQFNKDNPAFFLHKSPNYNKRQSSEYKLMMIDGKPAYARKSNHWGTFGTNIKDVDEAVKHLGISREEAESRQMDDPFGRIGTKYHNWSLTGGDEGRNTSQAGYVHLDDLDPIAKADGGDVDGITAYHGSPHDFEQFDTSKIGTGEGAQSYGHGLYFAGHEPVAKGYRDALSGDPISQEGVKPDWRDRGSKSFAQLALAQSMDKKLSGDDAIHDAMQDLHKNAGLTERKDIKQRYYDAVNSLGQMLGKEWDIHKGHMYEVHINAHPHHMLDWDKPLREQHEKIRRLAGWTAEHEAAHRAAEKVDNDNLHAALEGNGDYTPAKLPSRPHGALPLSATGADIYEHIKNKMGAIDWPIDADRETREQYRKSAAERASQYLLKHGIKGIKYLDAGSRGDKAEPTHNYVVFDHNDVNIKRKYERGGRVDYNTGGPVNVSKAEDTAGNFKKEHEKIYGIPVAIEVKEGHDRVKYEPNGDLKFKAKQYADYGAILGTKDADGMNTDVMVGPHKDSEKAYIIDQRKHDSGKFDEHKVMLGFNKRKKAIKAYTKSYADRHGKERVQDVVKTDIKGLKKWLKHGNLDKPASKDALIKSALSVVSKKT